MARTRIRAGDDVICVDASPAYSDNRTPTGLQAYKIYKVSTSDSFGAIRLVEIENRWLSSSRFINVSEWDDVHKQTNRPVND